MYFSDKKIKKNFHLQSKLDNSMKELCDKKTTKEHLTKMGEECSELTLEVFKNLKNVDNDKEILNEICDVLNTIDIYLLSIGKNKQELLEYRLSQVNKHLIKS